jgi:hypothetical protein
MDDYDTFIINCKYQKINIETLEHFKTGCAQDLMLLNLCANPLITPKILQWIQVNYPHDFINGFKTTYKSNYPLEQLLTNKQLSWDLFVLAIDHVIALTKSINILLNITCNLTNRTILHGLFSNEKFTPGMLNYLFNIDPLLNIGIEDNDRISPVFLAIIYSPNLPSLLESIKIHSPQQIIEFNKLSYSVKRWLCRSINSKSTNIQLQLQTLITQFN